MAYSDGRAIDVAAPADVTKGDFVRADAWNGIALETKPSGEYLALEVSAERFHWITLPAEVTGALGAIIYTTSAGVLTNSAGGNFAALKVVVAKDANNVVGARVLNIS